MLLSKTVKIYKNGYMKKYYKEKGKLNYPVDWYNLDILFKYSKKRNYRRRFLKKEN